MINWTIELPVFARIGAAFAVDPAFLRAIRETENGGPGREMGVLSVATHDFEDQVREAATTVAHRLATYAGNPLTRAANGRVIYAPRWIAYFAGIWAPVGLDVKNDPNELNKNWYGNCTAAYHRFVDDAFGK